MECICWRESTLCCISILINSYYLYCRHETPNHFAYLEKQSLQRVYCIIKDALCHCRSLLTIECTVGSVHRATCAFLWDLRQSILLVLPVSPLTEQGQLLLSDTKKDFSTESCYEVVEMTYVREVYNFVLTEMQHCPSPRNCLWEESSRTSALTAVLLPHLCGSSCCL